MLSRTSISLYCVLSHFSYVRLFATLLTAPSRLLCPWDSSGRSTLVGCHGVLQGIFLTQGLNTRLLHVLALSDGFFTTNATWEAQALAQITGLIRLLQQQKIKTQLKIVYTKEETIWTQYPPLPSLPLPPSLVSPFLLYLGPSP